jgi:hypothetical protein
MQFGYAEPLLEPYHSISARKDFAPLPRTMPRLLLLNCVGECR